jgi:hypothetical protein
VSSQNNSEANSELLGFTTMVKTLLEASEGDYAKIETHRREAANLMW